MSESRDKGKAVVVVDCLGRPPLANAHRVMDRWTRARVDKEWRTTAHVLARALRVAPMDRVTVDVEARYPGGRLPDPAAVEPAAKAVLDGIVDAGLIPDDNGKHVASITFHAATVARGLPAALIVTLRSLDPERTPK